MPNELLANLPTWAVRLQQALEHDDVTHRFFQLATVDEHNRPNNRTVVFRGFGDDVSVLTLVSDTHSAKCREMHYQPNVTVCWYMPHTREQFVLRCRAAVKTIADDRALVLSHWNALSQQAQSDYMKNKSGGDITTPPPWFCVIELTCHWVDYLNLHHGADSNRYYKKHPRTGSWSIA